jgi:hypothetical protein
MMPKQKYYAKHDPAIALLPLVRPVRRGENPPRLDVEISHDGFLVRVMGPYCLTALDQGVLLAVISIAGERSTDLEAGEPQHLALHAEGMVEKTSTRRISTTVHQIVERVYRQYSSARGASVEEALARLSAITVRAEHKLTGEFGQSLLLSSTGRRGGQIQVAINWRLAKIIAGDSHYAQISLSERLGLSGDIPKILHANLSGCLRPSYSMQIHVDKLSARVWTDPISPSGTRNRRQKIRNALRQIADLGWQIEFRSNSHVVSIRRPNPSKKTPAATRTPNQPQRGRYPAITGTLSSPNRDDNTQKNTNNFSDII